MTTRTAVQLAYVLAMAAVTAFVLAMSSAPAAAASRGVTDGILRIALPSGWSGSVGPGFQLVRGQPHPVAWILAGNFRFPSDAATHEGGPRVPRHKLLISVGDFVVTGRSLHWHSVQRLRFPARFRRRRVVSWHVRLKGRAVRLEVEFGSNPDADALALANRVLGSVSRQS